MAPAAGVVPRRTSSSGVGNGSTSSSSSISNSNTTRRSNGGVVHRRRRTTSGSSYNNNFAHHHDSRNRAYMVPLMTPSTTTGTNAAVVVVDPPPPAHHHAAAEPKSQSASAGGGWVRVVQQQANRQQQQQQQQQRYNDNTAITAITTADPIMQSDTYAEALRQLKQLEETAVRAKNYAVAARVQTATQAIETITAQLSEISRLEGTAVRERDYAAAEQYRHHEAALLHDLDANLNWDFWAHDAPAAQTTQSQFDPNSSSAPFTGAGTRATQAARLVPVRFSVACETAFGDSVVLVGSAPQLGAWSLHSTIPMTFVAGETWTCECVLPAGLEFEFKFIQRKEHDTEFVDPMWQEGENFVGSIPVDDDVRTVDMRCTWGADGDAATQESESRGGVSGGNLVWICRSLRRREKKVSQKTILD